MTEYKECPTKDSVETNGFKWDEKTTAKTWVKWLMKNLLLIITLFGVFLGVVIGISLRTIKLSETAILLISYPGELYMRALKLLILPLVMSSLITGSSSVNAKLNGKIALRTFIYFFLTSCFNALLGVILAVSIHPGDPGIKISLNNVVEDKKGVSVLDSLLDLGRSGTNNIGIVFFCIIFGSILGTIGSKGKVVKDFCSTIFDVVMKMVRGVIWITPFGLCSIIAGKIVSVADIVLVVTQLAWFIATVIIGVFIYQLMFLQLIYFFIVRKNPFKYYLSFIQSILTAFATASTAAVLPINFDVMDFKLKMNKSITRFVMPIGCNVNMDGTAMFLAIATTFVAQMSGTYLEAGTLVTIWLTSTIMSFSSASVPSAALVLLHMILSSLNIPLKDLPLLFAVDWLVDRFRTTNNMLGDCYTAAIVEKLSKSELAASESIQEIKINDSSNNFLEKSEDVSHLV